MTERVFYKITHKHVSSLICPFLSLSPGALSSSPVRHNDTRGGMVMTEGWWLCMVFKKCLLNYLACWANTPMPVLNHQTSSPRCVFCNQTQQPLKKECKLDFETSETMSFICICQKYDLHVPKNTFGQWQWQNCSSFYAYFGYCMNFLVVNHCISANIYQINSSAFLPFLSLPRLALPSET